VNAAICQAVKSRRVIRFEYGGGERRVEPHCHGFSAAGEEMMLAYQVGGYSSSGNGEGWKMFAVRRIGPLVETGDSFARARSDFDPTTALSRVHCSVSVLRLLP
jgi:hypothetical protein